MKLFSALTLFIIFFAAVSAAGQTQPKLKKAILSARQLDSIAFEKYVARRGAAQAIKDSIANDKQPAKINYAKPSSPKDGDKKKAADSLKNSSVKPNTPGLKSKQMQKPIIDETVVIMQSNNPGDRKKDFK